MDDKRKDGTEYDSNILKIRKIVFVFIVVILAGFSTLTSLSHSKKKELQIVMLDVGQGDGIYIRIPAGKHFFIDGGSSDITNVGTYRIEPFLKSHGVGKLDYVFISHGDADHTSGIEEMLTNQELGIQIQTLVLPPGNVLDESLMELANMAERNETRVVMMGRGDIIEEDEISIKCLAPSDDYSGEIGNASSMVLDLSYKDFDMLFTGDLENEGEELLTNSGLLRDYDVLKVGHHGSKNSTYEEFLNQVKPEIALISVGENNRYGHPAKETLERLEKIGCEVYSTKECGAIILKTDGIKMHLNAYL